MYLNEREKQIMRATYIRYIDKNGNERVYNLVETENGCYANTDTYGKNGFVFITRDYKKTYEQQLSVMLNKKDIEIIEIEKN